MCTIRAESEFSIKGNRPLVGIEKPNFYHRAIHIAKGRKRCLHQPATNAAVPEFFKGVDCIDFTNGVFIQPFISYGTEAAECNDSLICFGYKYFV